MSPQRPKHMKNKPPLADEDRLLFRATVGPVRELTQKHVDLHLPRPPRAARLRVPQSAVLSPVYELYSETDPHHPSTHGEALWFSRTGLQHGLLRKLRRGQCPIHGQLDLHGLTVPVAHAQVLNFLARHRAPRQSCVRIIHGKGHGSPQGRSILKHKVDQWLRQHDEVLAFCSAPMTDGGTGVTYVLLRRG